ncbi:nucleotide exchange factor GrpE [Porphyromonas uenonis]|uniref:nucleotide exchange factor GrpE n=1 Tax=Porphyromonas uenonis TaxID=281920 RepID=UPI0026F2F786|nr:nucleotide exchange factor GrpE [Porphyromonas uenonis]
MKKDNKKGGKPTEPQHIEASQETGNKQDAPQKSCETTDESETDAAATQCEEQRLAELQESLNKLNDQHLRMLAEYDNYRKRTLQEKSDLIKNGGERVLKELLPIVDDFELAVKHARESKSEEDPIIEGLLLIYNKLIGYLEKQGVVRIEATGAPFDDNLHEAVAMIPAPTPEQKGLVIDCVRTGYMLHDKVLRHAHVVVGN